MSASARTGTRRTKRDSHGDFVKNVGDRLDTVKIAFETTEPFLNATRKRFHTRANFPEMTRS
jgi:hypothetical protein